MITFKTARPEDIKDIENLVNIAYRGEFAKKGWTTEADAIDGQRTDEGKLLEMIEDPNSQIELAFEDGQLIGCIHIIREEKYASFGMLTVYPTLQQKGLGKILMERFEKLALEWGYEEVKLSIVTGRPELQSYYERRGYKLTGNKQPFPEDPRYGLPKTTLHLHEMIKKLSE